MSEVKRPIEETFPGARLILMPEGDVLNQFLKLSETHKERALEHLVSLCKSVNDDEDNDNDNDDIAVVVNTNYDNNLSCLELCKDFVEYYLSKPYLVYDPKDDQKLITKRDLAKR